MNYFLNKFFGEPGEQVSLTLKAELSK